MGDRTDGRGRERATGEARPADTGAQTPPAGGRPEAPSGSSSLDDYDFDEVAPAAVLRLDLLLDDEESGAR